MKKRKKEFSKIVLGAVMISYTITLVYAYIITAFNPDNLGELLTFVGAPTAVAIGFYAWKAKAENVVKLNSNEIKQKFIESECDDIVTGTDNSLDSGCDYSGNCDSLPDYQSESESKRVVKVRRIRSRKDTR